MAAFSIENSTKNAVISMEIRSKLMNFVFKTMDFVMKMMNSNVIGSGPGRRQQTVLQQVSAALI